MSQQTTSPFIQQQKRPYLFFETVGGEKTTYQTYGTRHCHQLPPPRIPKALHVTASRQRRHTHQQFQHPLFVAWFTFSAASRRRCIARVSPDRSMPDSLRNSPRRCCDNVKASTLNGKKTTTGKKKKATFRHDGQRCFFVC